MGELIVDKEAFREATVSDILLVAEDFVVEEARERAAAAESERLQEDAMIEEIMAAARTHFPEGLWDYLEYGYHDEAGHYPNGDSYRPPYAVIYLRIREVAPVKVQFELVVDAEGVVALRPWKSGGIFIIQFEAELDDYGDEGWYPQERESGQEFRALIPALGYAKQMGDNFEAIETECTFRNNAEKRVQEIEAREGTPPAPPKGWELIEEQLRLIVREEIKALEFDVPVFGQNGG